MQESKLAISHSLPIKWKRICTIGNWGHHNFGDELILIGLLHLLLIDKKNNKLFISGGDIPFLKEFHSHFFDPENLKSFHYIQEIPHGFRSSRRFLKTSIVDLKRYLSCDTFIIWGGELFTEETPGSYLYRAWSLLPYFFRKLFFWNTQLYIMGGIQAPKKRYNKLILKLLIYNAKYCFARDEESVQVAQQFGSHNTSWFIDTSYFVPMKTQDWFVSLSEYGNLLKKSKSSAYCIINTNPLSQQRTEDLSDIVRQQLSQWLQLYFLPAFFTTNPQQDDMQCYDKLKVLYPSLQLLDRRKRDKFIEIFTKANKIYCSRLHVFLVAAFLWLHVEPYPYQKKINKNISILKKCGIIA
jgi:polysaccharide pyruvyl transferase WcaK-like protein